MPAAHTRRLHAAGCRQVGRAQAHAVHAWTRTGDLLHVLHALGRLQQRMQQDRLPHVVSCLEQREVLIDEVNVPRTFDLRDHEHVELVAGVANDLVQVVQEPRAVEAVHANPQRRVTEVDAVGCLDESSSRRFLRLHGNCILEVAAQHVHLLHGLRKLGADLLQMRREEVDHTFGAYRYLTQRLRCADGERLVEVRGQLHVGISMWWFMMSVPQRCRHRAGRRRRLR